MLRSLDRGLLLAIFFLMGLGWVHVYSSSYLYSIESYGGDGLFFFRKQILYTLLAIVILLLLAYLPWTWSKFIAFVLWGVSCLGLIATFIPGIGIRVGGAYRWIQFPGGFRFEPGELLKVTSVFLVSTCLTHQNAKLRSQPFPPWIWSLQIIALTAPLIIMLQQPDFGSFVICALVGMFLVFVNGLRWRYLLSGLTIFFIAAFYLVLHEPYRLARIKAYMDPWSDPGGSGFQVIQSMLSFHSGGLFGVGLGQGQGKLFFLPEAHTDFTMAVWAEEMGYLGFLLVLLIYGFMIFRGLQIALSTHEQQDRLIAAGLTVTFALSVFINLGVVTGLLPTKGLTLPFLSYGGSSLLCTAAAMGWLLNLERSQRKTDRNSSSGVHRL